MNCTARQRRQFHQFTTTRAPTFRFQARIPRRFQADVETSEHRHQIDVHLVVTGSGAATGDPHHQGLRHAGEFTSETTGTDLKHRQRLLRTTGHGTRTQLQTTLTAAGSSKTFRDIALDDYLARRVQLGGAIGRFKSEPMLKLYASYKLSDTLSVEGNLGQVQGVFSGTNFWHLALHAEPWSDQRLSPFFGVGVGQFRNFPNQSLVGAVITDAKLAHAIVGARYYLSERFVLRADWALYTAFVSDQRSTEYRAVTAGVSFFF